MLRQSVFFSFITITSLILGGCASIVTGTNQSVSVNTGNVMDATCSLENDKGKWYVNRTPGSVTVHRSFQDLSVYCKKPGYQNAFQQIRSSTKGMVFGNVLFGGIIGAGVDTVNGAAYDYPSEITVMMKR